jgi:hypothetical protein
MTVIRPGSRIFQDVVEVFVLKIIMQNAVRTHGFSIETNQVDRILTLKRSLV